MSSSAHRPESGRATHGDDHEALHLDNDADAGRVDGTMAGIAKPVPAMRFLNPVGVVDDQRLALECEPSTSVNLAERAPASSPDVADLHAFASPIDQARRVCGS